MNQRLNEWLAGKVRPIELAELLKYALRVKRHELHFGDFNMYVDPASNFGLRLIKDGYYEKKTSEVLKELLTESDTFVDAGANEGYFSVLASTLVGKKGRIIAIEPQRRLGEVLLQNFRINSMINAVLLPFALGSEEGTGEIIVSPSINSGSSTLVGSSRNRWWKREKIYIQTIDNLLKAQRVEEVKLLKMDIEGYELFAIEGMHECLSSKKIRHVLIEFHPAQIESLGGNTEKIEEKLINYGYKKSDRYVDLYSLA